MQLRTTGILATVLAGLALAQAGDALADDRATGVQAHKQRTHLTGDWGGARTWLAEHGIVVDIQATQFYQGVTKGALDNGGKYGLKADYYLTFVGEKLGLWKGSYLLMHAETRQGQDVNDQTGISAANANLLMPSRQDITAITQLLYLQSIGNGWMVAVGKLNAFDFVDMVFHTGRGVDKFMNTSLVLPIGLGRTIPVALPLAGVLKRKGKEVQGYVVAWDPNNCATRSCLDPFLENGPAFSAVWKFFHGNRHGGRQGYTAVGGTWSTKQYTTVDRSSIAVIPGEGVQFAETNDSWSLFSVVDLPLWTDPSNPGRNANFKGMFSVTDGVANPIKTSASVALEFNGPIARRDKDTLGIGYFNVSLAGDFKSTVGPLLSLAETRGVDPALVDIENTNGFEVYYKAQLTPWFAVTGDLQLIEPTLSVEDTKVVAAVRGKIDF